MFGKGNVIKPTADFCVGNYENNEVLFMRVSKNCIKAASYVEVPVTHTAMVDIGGKFRYISESQHLFKSKEEIKNWKRGFTVNVVYFPKTTEALLNWGTNGEIAYRDVKSDEPVTVTAYGNLSVSITNPQVFYRKIVGVQKEFNSETFQRRFSSIINQELRDVFLKVILESETPYEELQIHQKEIATLVQKELETKFVLEWGIIVKDFIIIRLDLNEEIISRWKKNRLEKNARERNREAKEEIKKDILFTEDLKDRESDRQLKHEMVYGDTVVKSTISEKKCPICFASNDVNAMFCSKCGASFAPTYSQPSARTCYCKKCGADNDPTANFCRKCGERLDGNWR